MSDLAWFENNLATSNHEVGPDIAVGRAEFLDGHQRHHDTPCRPSETIGLDDHDNTTNGITRWFRPGL